MDKFLSYDEAKKAIRSMKNPPRTRAEYSQMAKQGLLPEGVFKNPYAYKGKGFVSLGDLLGTGTVAPQNRIFLSQEEAMEAIQSMDEPPTTQLEYFQAAKDGALPGGVPSDPRTVYGKEFVGYRKFLGVHRLHGVSRIELRLRAELEFVFGEERVGRFEDRSTGLNEIDIYVRELGVGFEYDGIRWHKSKISADKKKNRVAQSMGITIYRVREAKPNYSMGLVNQATDVFHMDGQPLFIAIKSLLTKLVSAEDSLPLDVVEKIHEYHAMNSFAAIPRYQELVKEYSDRWVSYEEAKKIIQELEIDLKTQAEFKSFTLSGHFPSRIPKDPYDFYVDNGWVSWGDFLGTGSVASYNKAFAGLSEAKELIRKSSVKPSSRSEYLSMIREGVLPDVLPLDPYNAYQDDPEWRGLSDFLGVRDRNAYVSYEEALEIIQKFQPPIKTQSEYRAASKNGLLPPGLPGNPQGVYKKKGWVSWYEFLGTSLKNQVRTKNFVSLNQAKELLRGMKNPPKTYSEYRSLAKKHELPEGMPKDPYYAYRGSGWKGYGDFLGTGSVAPFNKKFLSLRQAKKVLRDLSEPPRTRAEYEKFVKQGVLPESFPRDPYNAYGSDPDWRGMSDFLGVAGSVRSDKECV